MSASVQPQVTRLAPPDSPRVEPLTVDALVAALSVRDLTDPHQGAHAIQRIIDDALGALERLWGAPARLDRSRPVVAVEDNYDRLGYPTAAVARDARYTRYVSPTTMLRSHSSAGVPPALRRLATESGTGPAAGPAPDTVLLALPGLCHRRDSIDRLHSSTPHQLDLWLLRRGGRPLDHDDLHEMVTTLVGTVLPGRHWRWTTTEHPYTTGGRQVDVIDLDGAVEVAECGLADPRILRAAGLDPAEWSGLALGTGLDRLLMLRKGIPDIRLLRSADPRVAEQLLDLSPYRPISDLPPARRDVSVAVEPGADAELLGDRVRESLGARADLVEEVVVLSITPYADLPDPARSRLGIAPGQDNVLLRVVLRPVDRTLSGDDVNELRDHIYAALHQGRPVA